MQILSHNNHFDQFIKSFQELCKGTLTWLASPKAASLIQDVHRAAGEALISRYASRLEGAATPLNETSIFLQAPAKDPAQ
jgi:hypothetical protein